MTTARQLDPMTFPLHGTRLIEASARHRQDLHDCRPLPAPGAGARGAERLCTAPDAPGNPGGDLYQRRHEELRDASAAAWPGPPPFSADRHQVTTISSPCAGPTPWINGRAGPTF